MFLLQEIDELLGQNLTEEDEDAIAAELEAIIAVRSSLPSSNTCIPVISSNIHIIVPMMYIHVPAGTATRGSQSASGHDNSRGFTRSPYRRTSRYACHAHYLVTL